jgi:glutamyl/glutaminyl-tRNA synthetase
LPAGSNGATGFDERAGKAQPPPRSGPTATESGGPSPRPAIPAANRTRFAPAPTGRLHLGHVANALWVWGVAEIAAARVLLRIEDHDRTRSRQAFAEAILDDLVWLGFAADDGPVHQQDDAAEAAYRAALDELIAAELAYRCACTRATFAAWAGAHGRTWSGPGCPGACRARGLLEDAGTSLRVALGEGIETFDDLVAGPQTGEPAAAGDIVVRDRDGNWTYGFAVVVDDLRQGVDLVVRGEDLLAETSRQIRLGRLLGRSEPPHFLHHPLIRKADGTKLSKATGDVGVDELRAAGWSAAAVRAEAARLGAVPASISEASRRATG